MAVTGDKYELPIAVASSCRELAKMLDVSISAVYDAMYRAKQGNKHRESSKKVYRIELEEC